MSTSAPRGLASIIVPCWNQLEFTRHCVAALKKHTRMPWELIAIDNGSTDDTDVYLAGVRDGANVPVRIISNSTNRVSKSMMRRKPPCKNSRPAMANSV